MTTWQPRNLIERRETYSPIGLRLVDSYTGGAPVGRIYVKLDVQAPGGAYEETDNRAVTTLSGLVAFPNLGRSASSQGAPRQYRVRVTADHYRARYTAPPLDAVYFAAFPFSDDDPPAQLGAVQDLVLLPGPTYPFPAHPMPIPQPPGTFAPVNLLRGRVFRLNAGQREYLPTAEVHEQNREAVATDEGGRFVLPLRWYDPGDPSASNYPNPTVVDAVDPATGQTTTYAYQLPADLYRSVEIEMP